MATRKQPRRVRIASPAIWRDSEAAKRFTTEQREAFAGEAFALGDGLRNLTRGQLAEISNTAPFPTRAKYWTRHDPKRLRSPIPLPREGKAQAKKRAEKARRFFASEKAKQQHRRKREWRVKLSGVIEVGSRSDGSFRDYAGSNYGPWLPMPEGGLTAQTISEAYRNVARNAIAVEARHAPKWDQPTYTSEGFQQYRQDFYESGAILYVESAEIEVREL